MCQPFTFTFHDPTPTTSSYYAGPRKRVRASHEGNLKLQARFNREWASLQKRQAREAKAQARVAA